jgi:NAD(P)-dependent dehydrogenase (short-subunit alcohol dehydrogenase family)
MFSLKGRTALITGGTQGVGLAIARSIAQAGANVVLHGRTIDGFAQQAAEACRSFGVHAAVVDGELSGSPMRPAIDRLVLQVDQTGLTVDLLVNNAGTFIDVDFLEMDEDRFDRTWRLNVASGYFLTQAYARRWIPKRVPGRVLFTGSINGMLAEPMHTAYDASKGAVAAMVRSLCVSLAPHGIRVNSMAPGLVITPLTMPVRTDSSTNAWMQLHTPNGQVPDADVCGPAAVFLLSDEATHIHGQTLLVDGGMSTWQQPDRPAGLQWQNR